MLDDAVLSILLVVAVFVLAANHRTCAQDTSPGGLALSAGA